MALTTGTWCRAGRSAEKELAPFQQTSPKLHEETWAGLLKNQGLRISQEVDIIPECAVPVAGPACLDHSPVSPGPGRVIRNTLGWSQLEKTVWSGVWLFRGAIEGRIFFFFSPFPQQETG